MGIIHKKLYLHFEKERRTSHEKTHSNDWEILCGVDKEHTRNQVLAVDVLIGMVKCLTKFDKT